jgi:hypothetical protein
LQRGLSLGQLLLVNRVNTIQLTFFPGEDTRTDFEKSLDWITPILSAVLSFVPVKLPGAGAISAAGDMMMGGLDALKKDPEVVKM